MERVWVEVRFATSAPTRTGPCAHAHTHTLSLSFSLDPQPLTIGDGYRELGLRVAVRRHEDGGVRARARARPARRVFGDAEVDPPVHGGRRPAQRLGDHIRRSHRQEGRVLAPAGVVGRHQAAGLLLPGQGGRGAAGQTAQVPPHLRLAQGGVLHRARHARLKHGVKQVGHLGLDPEIARLGQDGARQGPPGRRVGRDDGRGGALGPGRRLAQGGQGG